MPKCSVLSELPTRQVEAGSKVIIAPLDFPSSGTDGVGMREASAGAKGWREGGGDERQLHSDEGCQRKRQQF